MDSTTLELLEFIDKSIKLIKDRFSKIDSVDDFLADDSGLEKLDSISMRIQAIGESVKNLYKRDLELLLSVGNSDYWSKIIRARDFISHHYIDLNAEIVYDICANEIEILEIKITQLIGR